MSALENEQEIMYGTAYLVLKKLRSEIHSYEKFGFTKPFFYVTILFV